MAELAALASLMQNLRAPEGVDPQIVKLPNPPTLIGPLEQNDILARAQKFAEGRALGPESLVIFNEKLYTGLSDGWVVEFSANGVRRNILQMTTDMAACAQRVSEDACGRPLGIRVDANGYLYVADAVNGIIKINPRTGENKVLVNIKTKRVNNKPLGYVNDLAVARDGTIFFTSSSKKYGRKDYLYTIFEAETTGSVLVFNPRATDPEKDVQELITVLSFPNGIQLSPDEKFLLIAEGARCRIIKAWIGNVTNRGKIEIFAENLPGFVDNLRPSPNGYWVGLAHVRHADLPSILDTYGDQPKLRGALMSLPKEQVMSQAPKYGIVVELNNDGKIIRSLHDPNGTLYTRVSEVLEHNKYLYIGSYEKPFIGVIPTSILPPISNPGSETGLPNQNQNPNPSSNQSGVVVNTGNPPVPPNDANASPLDRAIANVMSNVQANMQRMNNEELRRIMLQLVRELIMAKLEAIRAENSRRQLENILRELSKMIPPMRLPATAAPVIQNTTTTTTGTPVIQNTTTTGTPTASTTTANQTDAAIAARVPTTTLAPLETTVGGSTPTPILPPNSPEATASSVNAVAEGETTTASQSVGLAANQPAGLAANQPTGAADGQPAGLAANQPTGAADGQSAGAADGQSVGTTASQSAIETTQPTAAVFLVEQTTSEPPAVEGTTPSVEG